MKFLSTDSQYHLNNLLICLCLTKVINNCFFDFACPLVSIKKFLHRTALIYKPLSWTICYFSLLILRNCYPDQMYSYIYGNEYNKQGVGVKNYLYSQKIQCQKPYCPISISGHCLVQGNWPHPATQKCKLDYRGTNVLTGLFVCGHQLASLQLS